MNQLTLGHENNTQPQEIDHANYGGVTETQASLIVAQRCPRDEQQALDRIIMSCGRVTLAKTAVYQYARGGTNIAGPSIRLAETIARNWGNIEYGIRELDQKDGESVVEAFAWDKQTNTKNVKIFKIPHIRYTKKRQYKLEDPRDIYELVANYGSRRLRACILSIIPADIIDAAVEACNKTLVSNVQVTDERLKKMVEEFKKFGVTKKMIEGRIQRRLDINTISAKLMVDLGNIYNSIKDGMSEASEWFEAEQEPEEEKKSTTEKLKEKLKGEGE